MIINNKSIQGIFLYSETSKYERGDFVVSGDGIYICTPKDNDTVIGSDPRVDTENYTIYLGGDKATWEDFEEQFTNPSDIVNNDKLITSSILAQILRKIAFGLDSKGIISEHTNPISPNLNTLLTSSGSNSLSQSSIIDHILLTDNVPEFNNITVRVSRDLFKELLPDIGNLDYDDIDTNSVILKQYTYYESTSYTIRESENKIRVQEVIDHINGVCLYRFTRFGNEIAVAGLSEGKIGIASSWRLGCPNLQYLSKLNSLLKYIEEKSINKGIKNRFAFKDITSYLSNPSINLDNFICEYVLQVGSEVKEEDLKLSTITISVTNANNDLIHNYSLTIDLTNKLTYAFPNDITVKRDSNKLTLSWRNCKDIKFATISNIYVRSYEN